MSRYMTRKGYTAIQDEIEFLWRKERPEIVESVRAAAEQGDRSENAAYTYGKKRLREIDSRLRYLRKKVDDVTVVDLETIKPRDEVIFGARVTVDVYEGDADPVSRVYRLVDKDESEPKAGRISVQSPIGRGLLGKRAGDMVTLDLPKGRVELEVVEVWYGGEDDQG